MNHPTKLLWSILLLFGLTTGLYGQEAATVMSLDQAIDYALTNSPEIRDAQLEILDADAQVAERKSVGLPQLTGGASYQRYLAVPVQPLPEAFVDFLEMQNPGEPVSREVSFFLKNNLTTEVNLDAMLFDGVYFVGLQAARAARSFAQLDYANAQRTVRNNVKDAYLPLLLVAANLEQLDKNITNLEQLLFETRQTFEAGFVEQLDVDRIELSLANLRTERDNLTRQQEIGLRVLKFTINYPMDEPLAVADDLTSIWAEAIATDASAPIEFNRRPEVNLIDQAIQLNEYNVRVNRIGYWPSLRAFGAYQYTYQGDNFSDGFWAQNAFVGLRLNVPIFDGFYKKSLIQRARIDLDQTRLQRETLLRSINLEVKNARDSYNNARERLRDRQQNLDLAQRIYDTTQIKYREGVGSSLEVSQAEQALYSAQTNQLQALYEVVVAKTELDEALGLR